MLLISVFCFYTIDENEYNNAISIFQSIISETLTFNSSYI